MQWPSHDKDNRHNHQLSSEELPDGTPHLTADGRAGFWMDIPGAEGTGKDEDIWKIAFSRAFCEFLSGLKLLTII